MRPSRPEHRFAAALALSVGVHLVVAVALTLRERPAPPPPTHAPIDVKLVWLDAKPAPHAPDTPAPTKPSPPPDARAPQERQRTVEATHAAPADRPAATTARPVARFASAEPPEAPPAAAATPSDTPPVGGAVSKAGPDEVRQGEPSAVARLGAPGARADATSPPAWLLPGPDVLTPVMEAQRERGRTIRNEPGALPTEAELAAEAEARVATRVDGWAKDTLAEARVESGLVDPYFTDLRRRIAKGLEKPPDFDAHDRRAEKVAKGWVSSWRKSAEAYGRSGVPFEAPVSRPARPEVPTVLQREVERGSPQARELAQLLHAGARFRDFGDGRLGAELYAVVEIRQASSGSIESIDLLEGSGVPTFDVWVMTRAESAIEALGPVDAGAFPRGLRSTWGFSGRVTYKRDLKDATFKDDAWYLAAAALPGLLTGTFDELSGKVEYVDLRHPHYECRVKLLRVYDGAP